MKPAREPASSRPKPCASLKKPLESSPFANPCGSRRKEKGRCQKSVFPSEASLFAPLILAYRNSTLPWLVEDRAALCLRRIWCVPTRQSTTRPSATVLSASRVPPHLLEVTQLARRRRAPGTTILSQPYRRRVSTDKLDREGSQLAASLEGKPGLAPADITSRRSTQTEGGALTGRFSQQRNQRGIPSEELRRRSAPE